MFVIPKPGLLVPYPERPTAHLPAEGAEVPDHDTYWLRRARDGEVTVKQPETKPEGDVAEVESVPTRGRRSEK